MTPSNRPRRSGAHDRLRPRVYRVRSPIGAYLRALGAWLLAVAIALWGYRHAGREIRREAILAHSNLSPRVFEARVAERLDRFYAADPLWEEYLQLLGDVTTAPPILVFFVLAGALSLWLQTSRGRGRHREN